MDPAKSALVTGGAKRIGAAIVKHLHQAGFNIILHYHRSNSEAKSLADELNSIRCQSVMAESLDLNNIEAVPDFINRVCNHYGRLDVVVNNASSFYRTPLGQVSLADWDDLIRSNLTGAYFLCQAASPMLSHTKGSIINLIDAHIEQPAKDYSVYNIAKAGLWTLTKCLAKELAPNVRVNAVAPGLMIRPEKDYLSQEALEKRIERIPLNRLGKAEDIARTIAFLVKEAPYITGQMIGVDGGWSLLQGDESCDDTA